MDVLKLFVLSELVPDRSGNFCPVQLSGGRCLRVRVGEKKEFASIKAEHFRQSYYNQVGGVPFARFQVTNIRPRCLDTRSDFGLSEIKLSSPRAYYPAEVRFLRTPSS